MSQRLSRKEIKRDGFMESMGDALEWVQENIRMLIGAVAAVIAVVILIVIYMGYAERRNARADESFAKALQIYQSPVDPIAANPDDPVSPTFASASARSERAKEMFEATVDDFGRSDAALIARSYLGQIAADQGDMEGARSHWQDFLAKGTDHALAIEVQVNLMALDRASGQGNDLVTRLRAMLSGPDTGLPPDLLWYQLALTLEDLDRQEEAAEAFQRIVDEYPRSAFAPAARARTGGSSSPLFGS